MIKNENGKMIDGRPTINIEMEHAFNIVQDFREATIYFEEMGNVDNPVYFINGSRVPGNPTEEDLWDAFLDRGKESE